MDLESLGYRIRMQRKAMNMTQEQLAEKAGISVSFLGHIERGTRKAGLETFVLLANALGTSTDMLLRESLSNEVLRSSMRHQNALREINRLLQDSSEFWKL